MFPEEERVNGAMAEPVPILTSSDDESVEEGMTDSDVDEVEMDATSDYGSGEQQHVSDRSEEEGGWETLGSDEEEEEEDGDYGDGDHGEGGEVMEDAFATQDSDEVREEGNALFKEKKMRRFSLVALMITNVTIFSVQGGCGEIQGCSSDRRGMPNWS